MPLPSLISGLEFSNANDSIKNFGENTVIIAEQLFGKKTKLRAGWWIWKLGSKELYVTRNGRTSLIDDIDRDDCPTRHQT